MANPTYDWKRFWCARDGILRLDGEGFLVDPDQASNFVRSELETLADTFDVPALALLGEPGIGKSQAIADERRRLLGSSSGVFLKVDLAAFSDEVRLFERVFESPEVRRAQQGECDCVLMLDSLDECRLRIETVAAGLAEQMPSLPHDRLKVRIACRTAEWPSVLESALVDNWGQGGFRALELAPLRRVDVELAARAHEVEPGAFVAELNRVGAVPLAIKPITLQMLIRMYQAEGHLPSSRVEVYRKGCVTMCDDMSESRRSSGVRPRLEPLRRIEVAQRVAAISVLGNRGAIVHDEQIAEYHEDDLRVEECTGGTEKSQGNAFEITREEIHEVLGTGLFSSRGPGRLGWAHRTYEEFLAATYLGTHALSDEQLTDLLTSKLAGDVRAVPQLRETAAWVATASPTFFSSLLEFDPETLLRSDVAMADAESRAHLVGALLEHHDQGLVGQTDLFARERYERLHHEGLAEQLRTFVCDRGRTNEARRCAIEVAEACTVAELCGDLAMLARDDGENIGLRAAAAAAVSRLGAAASRQQLRGLAMQPPDDDVDDELKGYALAACWPGHLSPSELFGCLTVPKNEHLIGAYSYFLRHTLLLSNSDTGVLIAGLRWAADHCDDDLPERALGRMVGQLVVGAWIAAEDDEVRRLLCQWAWRSLRAHYRLSLSVHESNVFREAASANPKARVLVVRDLLELAAEEDTKTLLFALVQAIGLGPADVRSIIGLMSPDGSLSTDPLCAELACYLHSPGENESLEALYEARASNELLRSVSAWIFDPISVSGERAAQLRAQHAELRPDADHADPSFDLCGEMERCVSGFERGDSDGWWRLYEVMRWNECGRSDYKGDIEIESCVGWRLADDHLRSRIRSQAYQYVVSGSCNWASWLGTNHVNFSALAGYRALLLVADSAPDQLDSLDAARWAEWAPILFAWPRSSKRIDLCAQLIEKCCASAPQEARRVFEVLVQEQITSEGGLRLLNRIPIETVMCFEDLALGWLDNEAFPHSNRMKILSWLLAGGSARAEAWAHGNLSRSKSASTKAERDSLTGVICALVVNGSLEGWTASCALAANDHILARELALRLGTELDRSASKILSRLDDSQTGDLFLWLARAFPHSQDRAVDGQASFATEQDEVRSFRDSVLRELAERGTTPACEELQRLATSLPHLGWLKHVVLSAQSQARRNEWVPALPGHILQMGGARGKRSITNVGDLLALVESTIRGIGKELYGQQRPVQFLWNTTQPCRPKSENELSDWLCRELRSALVTSGVVVNREVEIRPSVGQMQGERTDLTIEATRPLPNGTTEALRVIIEVKGCWNQELKTAMKGQLVERYLRGEDSNHGIYVVGWFRCEAWDEKDSRRGKTPNWDAGAAQSYFADQAEALCTDSRVVRALVIDSSI